MTIKYSCLRHQGELGNHFDRDEEVMTAFVTAGAMVALADGRVDPLERDVAIDYIHRRRLAPTISRRRIAECFDARVRALQDRDCPELIDEAFQPVARLELVAEVVRFSELIAAADGHLRSGEAQVVTLLRLMMLQSGAADQDPEL